MPASYSKAKYKLLHIMGLQLPYCTFEGVHANGQRVSEIIQIGQAVCASAGCTQDFRVKVGGPGWT
jgi:hypothetical protein